MNTIVTETITTVEQFVALGITDQETIDVVNDIFENNDVGPGPTGEIEITPHVQEPPTAQVSFESVEAEMNLEIPTAEIAPPTIEVQTPTPTPEVASAEATVEVEIETEISNAGSESVDMETPAPESQETAGGSSSQEGPVSETEAGSGEQPSAENASEDSSEPEEAKVAEAKPKTEEKTEPKPVAAKPKAKVKATVKPKKVVKKQTPKQKKVAKKKQQEKAAKKILKKMGDKGKYSNVNQAKTLVVMQVLGDTKTFFNQGIVLKDAAQFYKPTTIPGGVIQDNVLGGFLFNDSNIGHNSLVDLQYR